MTGEADAVDGAVAEACGDAAGAAGESGTAEAAGAQDIPELAREIVALATGRGIRLAVAESLTGGRLADAIVSVPGASLAFSGGIVAYDTALKQSLLGVDAELLRERGPVDPEVARQMARGVREACAVPRQGRPTPADIGVATTGVAGPDPDPQTGQPPGTVWIGLSDGSGSRAEAVRVAPGGDRSEIRTAAVGAALRALRDALAGE